MKTSIQFSRGSTGSRRFFLGHCVTVLLLSMVTCIGLPQESFGKTIAVEGWNSEGGGDRNQFFVTARFIDPATEEYTYPGALSPDKTYYSNVEQMVYNSAINAIQSHQTVNLLGYSHGAVAVLNVLKRLDSEGVSLANVSVITVDEVINVLGFAKYPLKNPAKSVPPGVGRALNIYQRKEKSASGAQVRRALNIDASQVLVNELTAGRSIDQEDPLFWPDYGSYHIYIQGSLAVRRRILEAFAVPYLGGIWQFAHTDCANNNASVYVLNHDSDGVFTARRYVSRPGFTSSNVFHGNVTQAENLLLTGAFQLVAYAPDCPNLGYTWITGSLTGSATASGRSLNMDLQETMPVYDPTTCEWLGTVPCDGAIQGTVLYAMSPSMSSSAAMTGGDSSEQAIAPSAVGVPAQCLPFQPEH